MARALGDYSCVKQFQTIPNAGHCPMDEAWEETNEILRDWLQTVAQLPSAVES